jgi:hypothetical protein
MMQFDSGLVLVALYRKSICFAPNVKCSPVQNYRKDSKQMLLCRKKVPQK